MITRTSLPVPAHEYRRIVKTAAIPVTAPVNELESLRQEVDRIAVRDRDATKRTKLHMLLISVNIILTVALTFIPLAIALHFGPVLAGTPQLVQELADWVHGW